MIPFIPRKVAQRNTTRSQPPALPQPGPSQPGSAPPQNDASTQQLSLSSSKRHLENEEKRDGEEGVACRVTKSPGIRLHPPEQLQAYADLLCLSLSDYALWSDPNLRRTVESDPEGYIPLRYLLHQSTHLPFLLSPSHKSETALVKAIRSTTITTPTATTTARNQHAYELVEVRVLFTSPLPNSAWASYGSGSGKGGASSGREEKTEGGYEVRLRDWQEALGRARNSARWEWEERTVYMENIPLQYRSLHGIYRFTHSVLHHGVQTANSSSPYPDPPLHPPSKSPTRSVQNITLPRHHLDKPTDQPKCKGFALVTLSTVEEAEKLASEWAWERDWAKQHNHAITTASSPSVEEDEEGEEEGKVDVGGEGEGKVESGVAREAMKFGFRVLRKARWEKLQREYLARQVQLHKEVVEAEDGLGRYGEATVSPVGERNKGEYDGHDAYGHPRAQAPSGGVHPPANDEGECQQQKVTTLSSPYPYDCLVFARNVHPETNKTTLRALFSHAFADSSGACHSSSGSKGGKLKLGSVQEESGLDYVDFTKGLNTCYLRVATPDHATHVLTHFTRHPTVQSSGLDNFGSISTSSSSAKPIVLELIQGKREELYWEKVPEKVRRQAVQKAVGSGAPYRAGDAEAGAGDDGERKRKRRKRG